MARDRNTDTPLTPEVPAGQNPPDGAILDYYLGAASVGAGDVEVFDHLGKPVRKYSSNDKPEPINAKELNVPTYWIRMPKVLSAEAGMHRWVWDLRLGPPGALAHSYPISAIYHDTPRYPLGPWVMPGVYTIKLTVDGKTYTQALTVKMDPRNKTGVTGLTEQYRLATKLWSAMNEDYAAIEQIRKVRAALHERREKGSAVANGIADLDQKLAAIEGAGGGRGRGAGGGANSLSRLNGELSQILEIVAESDQTPTVQATTAAAELRKSLDAELAKWNAVKAKDIPALNGELQKAGLEPLP